MSYSKEEKQIIFDEVIKLISEDGMSLIKAIYQVNFVRRITKSTFLDWMKVDKEMSDQYARAMSVRADILFEEILEISDDDSKDYEELEISEGVIATKINQENIQRSKLRVDSRKWMLGKMQPKKYGDKLDVTTDGKEINTTPTIVFKKFKNDE